METRRVRDLQVWQRSMRLARILYELTDSFPKSELFGLTSQIRRAAVSVPSNIAEGRGRATDKTLCAFLGHAQGSLYELQKKVELSRDLGFAPPDQADPILKEAAEIAAMINSLLAKLKSSG